MKRTRKILITALLTTVVLAGSIGGAVMAADDETEDTGPAGHTAMLEKVCEIYEENTGDTIDLTALQEAFAAARDEMCPEGTEKTSEDRPTPPAMDAETMLERLQAMLDDGEITQEQYDEFAAWVDAMPDDSDTEAYQEWLESRPDSLMPFGPAGHGGHKGPGGHGGAPEADTETTD